MSAKPVRIEIIVFVLFCSITWPNPSNRGHNCHLENSNVVRKIIQKKFVPILERYKSALPVDCPFHAGRDLYGRRREGPELEGDPPGVVCWFCGLAFVSPKQLRHHYEIIHAESMALHEGAVCLADYCAIMRCNVLMANDWLTSLNNSNKVDNYQKEQERRLKYPQHSSDAIEAEVAGRLAAKESLRAREEARRGACNSTELRKLQDKCQVIVRSCISNLLLSLSPKDFQEIEEDMNRAVCSFLTCEKFWEDSLVEEPRYTLSFFLAVLTMLGIGMIICYYIVWVVFDSGETTTGHQEHFEVYVLYSEHLVEAKAQSATQNKSERRTRRPIQSMEDDAKTAANVTLTKIN